MDFDPFTVQARLLPTVLQRGRFLSQTVRFTREKIVISTPGPFNLSRQEEEIPWRKVAGFDYRSGIFWDRVTVETRGQSSSTMACLAKEDGQRIRRMMRQVERWSGERPGLEGELPHRPRQPRPAAPL